MVRALAVAWLAASVAPGACVAQAGKSLVSTRLEVGGLVQRKLSLSVDDLRALAQRRGQAAEGGYGGIRLTDVLEEADIRQDERHALRRTYVVASASDGYQALFSWGELFNRPSAGASSSPSSATPCRCETGKEASRWSRRSTIAWRAAREVADPNRGASRSRVACRYIQPGMTP